MSVPGVTTCSLAQVALCCHGGVVNRFALCAIVAIGLVAVVAFPVAAAPLAWPSGLRHDDGSIADHPALTQTACADDPLAIKSVVVRCGLIEIDRPNGLGRNGLSLWVAVAGPRSTHELPLVVVPGGPGRAGTTDIIDRVQRNRGPFLTRDVVLLDPRGTGQSDGLLDCASFDTDWPTSCFETLLPERVDVGVYSASAIADDLEALRESLGIEAWHVRGDSYGAEIAQHLALRHPKPVRSIVLAAPTSIDVPQPFDRHVSIRDAVHSALELCEASPECSQGQRDLSARFEAVLERLATRPLSFAGPDADGSGPGATLDAHDAVLAAWWTVTDWNRMHLLQPLLVSLELGHVEVWNRVLEPQPAAAAATQNNNVQAHPLNDLSAWQERRTLYRNWILNHTLTLCNDGAAGQSHDDWRTGLGWWDSWRSGRAAMTACDALGVAEPMPLSPASSDAPPPMLILAGALDPIAPATGARLITQRFPTAHLVVLPWYAHEGMWSDPCPQLIASDFRQKPTSPVDDGCVADLTFANIYGDDCDRFIGLAVPAFCDHVWYDGFAQPAVP